MSGIWNIVRIEWPQAKGFTNVVGIRTAGPAGNTLYWWRNELPGETLSNACRDFYGQFPFAALATNCASCIVDERSPDGALLIQEQEFSFTTAELNLFGEE
jgi:hypothetical protein